jgi:hypothetical protein
MTLGAVEVAVKFSREKIRRPPRRGVNCELDLQSGLCPQISLIDYRRACGCL